MKTFQDLIRDGVAPNRYDAVYIGQTPNADPFVRGYNNVWGVVSDTHMSSYGENQYIITGSMVRNSQKFSSFLYAYYWGGYSFNAAEAAKVNGIRCLSGYISKNGLVGEFSKVNNDDVYILSPRESLGEICPNCCCVGCCDAKIGESENTVFSNNEVKEQVLQKGTAEEIINRLNESKGVSGQDWDLVGDADGLKFVNENRKYILVK